MAQRTPRTRAAPEVACPDSVVVQIFPEDEDGSRPLPDDREAVQQEVLAAAGADITAAWNAAQGVRRRNPPLFSSADQSLSFGGPHVQEFEVEIRKDGEEVGVDVLQQGIDTLLVNKVKVGPLMTWNMRHPDRMVRPGDRLVAANGVEGNIEKLIAVIKADNILRLRVRRLLEYSISIEKNDRLGIDVAHDVNGFRIVTVGKGPFQDWNAQAGIDHQVRPGDYIVEVNGLRGDHSELLRVLQQSSTRLDLVLARGGATPPRECNIPTHGAEAPSG